jgi:hypothetical protein
LGDGTGKFMHNFLNKIAFGFKLPGAVIDLTGLESELEG